MVSRECCRFYGVIARALKNTEKPYKKMFRVKGFRGINTFKKARKKRPGTLHELLSALSMLEHERDRLIREKTSWGHRIESINARLAEIEDEKEELNQPKSGEGPTLPNDIFGGETGVRSRDKEIVLRY